MQFSRLALILSTAIASTQAVALGPASGDSLLAKRQSCPAGWCYSSFSNSCVGNPAESQSYTICGPPSDGTAGAATYVCTPGSGQWVQTAKCASGGCQQTAFYNAHCV
ncbi:hypothetical protein DFH08DRAFT_846345 [Mycena albidolilacea]|uniref:Uncharacterized protein n=1 Tax=Mycena albidolilacea TaxID=1033008 RepID=A0AAD7AID0_9AGAR|nr:hypothetical protein DFH08DRAFT_846345 [Mycena albidolilacea]